MKFEITYVDELVKSAVLVPEPNEDENYLYNLSCILKVKNPAMNFSEMAKAGAFKDISDEEYEFALSKIKKINELFFKKQSNTNVFALVNEMMEYFLKAESF